MSKFEDLTGQKFGRLTVIERVENNKRGSARWLCRCDCSNEVAVTTCDLKSGNTQSCGCLQHEKAREIHTIHGMRHTKIYNIWKNMKQRCLNSSNPNFKYYGGRGITIYPAWINNFQAFYDYVSKLEHFGEEGYTLDRINNNGNYEPNNLHWVTAKEQSNNRRSNHFVDYYGEEITLAEAAERTGINFCTLLSRVKVGDTGERLFRPVKSSL